MKMKLLIEINMVNFQPWEDKSTGQYSCLPYLLSFQKHLFLFLFTKFSIRPVYSILLHGGPNKEALSAPFCPDFGLTRVSKLFVFYGVFFSHPLFLFGEFFLICAFLLSLSFLSHSVSSVVSLLPFSLLRA